MLIIRRIYEKLSKDLEDTESKIKEWQDKKMNAYAEGDTSENADYEDACKKLADLYITYQDLNDMILHAEVIDEYPITSIIEIGAIFNLIAEHPGNMLTQGDLKDANGKSYLAYDTEKDTTVFNHIVCFGAPVDTYTTAFDSMLILNTETNLAKLLLGKPLGTYPMTTSTGQQVTLQVQKV